MLLKIGIVGIGHIAKLFHIPAWKQNKFSKIVSLCDISKSKLKTISKKLKIKSTYTNINEMLKKDHIDVVDICTPPSQHYRNIISAIKFKKHIFVEKPFVVNTRQSKDIINRLKKSKLFT